MKAWNKFSEAVILIKSEAAMYLPTTKQTLRDANEKNYVYTLHCICSISPFLESNNSQKIQSKKNKILSNANANKTK